MRTAIESLNEDFWLAKPLPDQVLGGIADHGDSGAPILVEKEGVLYLAEIFIALQVKAHYNVFILF